LQKYDPDLAQRLRNDPYLMLSVFGDEVYYIAQNIAKDINPKFLGKKLNVHLSPPKKSDTFKAKTVKNLNKLIVLEGIIVAKTQKFPHLKKVYLRFEHSSGKKNKDNVTIHEDWYPELGKELYGILKLPTRCTVCGERATKIIRDRNQDIKVDWQKAKLQERPEDLPPGKEPDVIELVFEDDLVDSVLVGEEVKIIGILKEKHELGETNNTSTDFYVKVVGVEKINSIFSEIKLAKEDEEKIKELSKDPNIIEKITKSIAPSLKKHLDDVKEAIALSLFGGNELNMPDGTTRRGRIHVLIMGDPAIGKSNLAPPILQIAPRGVLATGSGSTGVGLTASVDDDKDLQRRVLRAGALPLANGGVLVIDEIDELNEEDRGHLLTAMEQGIIEIHKWDIHQQLTAKATIIGFGNPIGGEFDPDKDILDQFRLKPQLRSRFDLIFAIKRPRGKDALEIDEYVIKTQTAISGKENLDKHFVEAQIKPPIELDLLRKYIIYAKQKIVPQWTPEAMKHYVDYVKYLRELEDLKSKSLITERQIEGLRRISEAYARMRLSQEVTVDDVKRAINIFNKSLKSLGIDIESGEDITTLMTGESEGDREVEKIVLQIIDQHTGNGGVVDYGTIEEELEDILKERHLDKGSLKKALEKALAKLVDKGDITTVGTLNYKIVKQWHW